MAFSTLSQIKELAERLLQTPSDNNHQHLQVQEDLKELQRMVQRIRALLTDAEKREIHAESVRLWLRELKVLAYDAEDVLDEFQYDLQHAKVEAGIQEDATASYHLYQPRHRKGKFEEIYGRRFREATGQPSNHTPEAIKFAIASPSSDASFWGKLADQIKKIRERFEEISKQRNDLHLREGEGERQFQNIIDRPPSSHFVDAPTIYGRGHDLEEVINKLLYSDECKKINPSVLPIVGMGGVGKTTLVQHVYNDQRTCDHFQMKGWVCVSDDFAVARLTTRIIESFTKEECRLKEFSVLQEKLKELLDQKRFLLVLDDVWNENHTLWQSLQKPLRFGMQGSVVIITTRNESVANIMKTMPFHYLNCLSFYDCLAVFLKSAFIDQDPYDHPHLVEIGKKVVKKCSGLPLAAKSLGGLLSYKNTIDEWEEVLQSDIWDLHDQGDEIIPALRLCYHHLPSYLKQCFLYASIFPKDFTFKKGELILLWMAQGFLQCRGNKHAEDVGNMYFNELVQRSLFHCCAKSTSEINLDFVMHDLIHDLAHHISGGEFLHMDGNKAYFLHSDEVRHLSVVKQEVVGLEKMFRPTWAIRTLVLKRMWVYFVLRRQMMQHLKSLRVLDLEFSCIDKLPDSIGNLKHLRYLNLSETNIISLPNSVCKLYNLQTLFLVRCERLIELPEDVKNLRNLQHLNIGGTEFCLPSGFGKLTSLCALDVFKVPDRSFPLIDKHFSEMEEYFNSGGIGLLKELNHLRGTLLILNLKNVMDAKEATLAELWNKKGLKNLGLWWNNKSYERTRSPEVHTQVLRNLRPPEYLEKLTVHGYTGHELPSWMGDDPLSLSKLVHLELWRFQSCESLPLLGQLPSLKSLHIGNMKEVKVVGLEFYGQATVGFPALESLHFEHMESWVKWEMAGERPDVFPCLRRLELLYCPCLVSMVPLYHLSALEELEIKECRQLESIELWSRCSPMQPPPLRCLIIISCPFASFSQEDNDEKLMLPPTIRELTIRGASRLVEWLERGKGRRLAHIPNAQVLTFENGYKMVMTRKN